MPAECPLSLSLEVSQAEKSFYLPGTWAWSLPATSACGSVWLPPAIPSHAHHLGEQAVPPSDFFVLTCPQSWASPYQKAQTNSRPWKYWQGGSKSLCVLAAQLEHSPGVPLTQNPHMVPSEHLAQVVRVWSPPQSMTRGERPEEDSLLLQRLKGQFPMGCLP